MNMNARLSILLFFALCLAHCAEQATPPDTPAVTPPPPATTPSTDWSAYKTGDRWGELTVTDVKQEPNQVDSSFVGTIRWAGQVRVSGRYRTHPDYPEVKSPCFEVLGDDRSKLPAATERVWFCFDNADEAVQKLGPVGQEFDTTIVITDYVMHRYFTDAVNSARLVADGGR